MGSASINGLPVMEGRVLRPRIGNWVAELVVDAATADLVGDGKAAILQTDGGALTFAGTVFRSGSYVQNVTLRMVGGAGGLIDSCRPRFYAGVRLSDVLSDLLGDGGEVVSDTSDASALETPLGFWSMLKQQIGAALTSLVQAVGPNAVWRVNKAGGVFVGTDGFSQSALTDFELIEFQPLEGVQLIATENPQVNPGETFNGRKVSTVEHRFGPDTSRTKVWFE